MTITKGEFYMIAVGFILACAASGWICWSCQQKKIDAVTNKITEDSISFSKQNIPAKPVLIDHPVYIVTKGKDKPFPVYLGDTESMARASLLTARLDSCMSKEPGYADLSLYGHFDSSGLYYADVFANFKSRTIDLSVTVLHPDTDKVVPVQKTVWDDVWTWLAWLGASVLVGGAGYVALKATKIL